MGTRRAHQTPVSTGVLQYMQVGKWRVLRDVIASFLIFSIIVNTGQGITIGISAIGLINSVEVADLVRAYQQYQREDSSESGQQDVDQYK